MPDTKPAWAPLAEPSAMIAAASRREPIRSIMFSAYRYEGLVRSRQAIIVVRCNAE